MSLLWARCVFSFGYNVVGVMGGYMQTYYVFGGDIKRAAPVAAAIGSSFHVAGIIMSLAGLSIDRAPPRKAAHPRACVRAC